MRKYPKPLTDLITVFNALPGIGIKTAERLAFAVLDWDESKINTFSEVISSVNTDLDFCELCGNIAEKNSLCVFCSDPLRNKELICVVENSAQAAAVESGGVFNGLYHILGGKLAPVQGKNIEDLNFATLENRVKNSEVKEVIIALGHDVESRATSMYITSLLESYDVRITIPARGLPAGSDIAYADPATLAAAFAGRRIVEEDRA